MSQRSEIRLSAATMEEKSGGLAPCSEQGKRRRRASPASPHTFPVKPLNSCPASPWLVCCPVSNDWTQYSFAAQQFPGGGFPGFFVPVPTG